ncbi:MAG: hypothetical protein ACWA5X_04785 [bacterium]
MAMHQTIEELEARVNALEPAGMSPARIAEFEAERGRIKHQLTKLKLEQAESWEKQDWLAMIENSLDLLGHKVAGWMSHGYEKPA